MRNECHFLASVDISRTCVLCPLDPLTGRSSLGNLRCLCVLFFSFVNVIRVSFFKLHSCFMRWPMRHYAALVWPSLKRMPKNGIRCPYAGLCVTRVTRPWISHALAYAALGTQGLNTSWHETHFRRISTDAKTWHYALYALAFAALVWWHRQGLNECRKMAYTVFGG